MHLTKSEAIWFLWPWGLICEDEANKEDFKGKITAILGKPLARRLPFHLRFSFVVNATTELAEQIKRNIREQINQAVVPTWTLIMLEAGEGLECQQQ